MTRKDLSSQREISVMDEMLKRLIARREAAGKDRDQLVSKRSAIAELAEQEQRDNLSDEEDNEFRSLTTKIKENDEEIRKYDERIAELTDEIERNQLVSNGAQALKRAQARVQVVSEARTYEKGNGQSYMRDLALVQMNMDSSGEARMRLQRHSEQVATDPEFRKALGLEHRDLNRTDGTGGYFVPPLWMVSQYVALARPGRAFANIVQNEALPAGTDSINIPKIASGTTTDIQNGDNTAVSNTDLADTSVRADVKTIAGQQNVALQLLDQSPISFDQVVFQDLTASYAAKVDLQTLVGTGSNGQVLGVHNTSGIQTQAVTGTGASNAIIFPDVYRAIAGAINSVHTSRFLPPTHIAMHPRRWAWFLSQSDSAGRPLVVPNAQNGFNMTAAQDAVISEGVVGSVQGLPVVIDPNVPTNLGGDSASDPIYVLRASDLILYESGIRARALPQPNAASLTTLLQVYSYVAFTAGRYPQSIVEIAPLVAPQF